MSLVLIHSMVMVEFFCNPKGFSRGCFSLSTGIMSAFVVELIVAILAIKKVWHMGWHSLWIESDSIYVV